MAWHAGRSRIVTQPRSRRPNHLASAQSNPLISGVWRQSGRRRMIYQNFQAYDARHDCAAGRHASRTDAGAARCASPGTSAVSRDPILRKCGAAGHRRLCELIARAGLSHRRPAFGIDQVEVAGRPVAVREVAVHRTPFCTLLRFEKEHRRGAAAGAAGGADVGAFRHSAARHRAHDAGRTRRLHHRLAQRPRRRPAPRPLRFRRLYRPRHHFSGSASAPARISSRSASPASPRWRPSRSWPRTAIRRSRAA